MVRVVAEVEVECGMVELLWFLFLWRGGADDDLLWRLHFTQNVLHRGVDVLLNGLLALVISGLDGLTKSGSALVVRLSSCTEGGNSGEKWIHRYQWWIVT